MVINVKVSNKEKRFERLLNIVARIYEIEPHKNDIPVITQNFERSKKSLQGKKNILI